LADASHELRTPLAAMKGNIEILNRGAMRDPKLRNESLDDMQRETERLIRLVNDLLMLAVTKPRRGCVLKWSIWRLYCSKLFAISKH
jgi:signal transduction histidine kinase